jgi:hypothetical protein
MTPEQLMGMSVKELKTLAEDKGIARAGKMRKEELVQALMPHSRAPHPGSPTVAPSRAPLPLPGAPMGGSSVVSQKATSPQTTPEQGLPIPDHYQRDRLVLMVQDPQHIFAYWEVTEEHLAAVRRLAGEGAAAVLVLITGSGTEQREVDLRGGNYYLAVAPNGTYQAQLALRDRHGKLFPLATSNQIATPAASVSTRTDEQWMAVDEQFHELLAMAGLPGHIGSSMTRLADQRVTAWSWKESGVRPFSSGVLSSHSFSSHSLVAMPDLEQLLKR